MQSFRNGIAFHEHAVDSITNADAVASSVEACPLSSGYRPSRVTSASSRDRLRISWLIVWSRISSWLVTVEKANISVTAGNGDAGCVVRADKAVFDKIAAGRLNAVAAVLRGDLEVQGDWRLLVRMQRLFPGPRASQRKATA